MKIALRSQYNQVRVDTHHMTGFAIQMTCGGGMGGSSWITYVVSMDMTDHHFIKAVRLANTEVMLGKNFVVEYCACDFVGQTVINEKTGAEYTEWYQLGKGCGKYVQWIQTYTSEINVEHRPKPVAVIHNWRSLNMEEITL